MLEETSVIDRVTELISDIGKANKGTDRGEFKSHSNASIAEPLNKLANLFYFTGPYISVVQVQDHNEVLHVSLPGTVKQPKKLMIPIQEMLQKLKIVMGNPGNVTDKIKLFISMCEYGQTTVKKELKSYIERFRDNKVKNNSDAPTPTQLKLIDALTHLRDGITKQVQPKKELSTTFSEADKNLLLKDNDFKNIATKAFDTMISKKDIPILNKVIKTIKTAEVVPYPMPNSYDSSIVHVESKAIWHVSNKYADAKIFNIGLSSEKAGNEVGCCALCTLEFTTLERLKNYTLNRWGDYPENFPTHIYELSYNVIADNAVFNDFFQQTYEAIQTQIDRNSTKLKYSSKIHSDFDTLTKMITPKQNLNVKLLHSSKLTTIYKMYNNRFPGSPGANDLGETVTQHQTTAFSHTEINIETQKQSSTFSRV